MEIKITVKEIRGQCPTYRVGDSFTLKAGYQLMSDTPVCMHGLAALMPYYNALRVITPFAFPSRPNGAWTARRTNPRPIFNARIRLTAPTAALSSSKSPSSRASSQ